MNFHACFPEQCKWLQYNNTFLNLHMCLYWSPRMVPPFSNLLRNKKTMKNIILNQTSANLLFRFWAVQWNLMSHMCIVFYGTSVVYIPWSTQELIHVIQIIFLWNVTKCENLFKWVFIVWWNLGGTKHQKYNLQKSYWRMVCFFVWKSFKQLKNLESLN